MVRWRTLEVGMGWKDCGHDPLSISWTSWTRFRCALCMCVVVRDSPVLVGWHGIYQCSFFFVGWVDLRFFARFEGASLEGTLFVLDSRAYFVGIG